MSKKKNKAAGKAQPGGEKTVGAEFRPADLAEQEGTGAAPEAGEVPLGVPLSAEEYEKLRKASNRDVHDSSKNTTLPIAREIVEAYVMGDVKLPWYIDLLNINLENLDLTEAKRRIRLLAEAFRKDGTRITENLDFGAQRSNAQ